MAREDIGLPQVAPQQGGAAYQNMRPDASAFGGDVGQSLQRAGGNLAQASINLFQLSEHYDAVAVDDQINQVVERANKIRRGDPTIMTPGPDGQPVPDTGYLGTTGRVALDRREPTLKSLDEEIAQGRKNLKTPLAQQRYDQQIRRYRTQWDNEIGSHAQGGFKTWSEGVNAASAQHAINDIGANPDDPQKFAAGASDLINARVKEAQAKYGNDPKIMQEVIAGAKREALKVQVTAIGVRDPARAMEILDKNRDIAGADYATLSQTFRGRADQVEGIAAGNRYIEQPKEAPTYGNPDHPSFAAASNAAPGGFSARGLARLVQIESRGDPNAVSPSGKHKGLTQFGDEAWAAHGQGDRSDPEQSIRAAARYGAANAKVLERVLGRKPTDAELYLAHQQGPGGASKLLGNPNARAGDALFSTGAYKTQGAADEAIRQNGGDPDAPAWQFTQKWMAKFDRGGGPIAATSRTEAEIKTAILNDPDMQARPQMMDAALGQVNKVFATRRIENSRANEDFKQRVKDTTAEAMTTGSVKVPLTEADFIARRGEEDGQEEYEEYKKNLQLGTDAAAIATMTPAEQAELFKRYQPVPGQEYFGDQAQRLQQLGRARTQLEKEKEDDPASFAIRRLPPAREAYAGMATVFADPKATPEQKQQAARTFADVTMSEQLRVGVPRDQVKIVPQAYVDQLNARLTTPSAQGGTLAIAQGLEAEAKLWGDHWPQVMRQLDKQAQPVVRVIGSGLRSSAAQILTDVAGISVQQILKDDNTERDATIKKDVLDAFKPLASSLAGNEGGLSIFNDFRGQAEKLAAVYVVNGMTSADAARRAFDDMVGFKYAFQNGYRIPKDVGVAPEVIAEGAVIAKRDIGKIGIKPAADTVGGLSEEYRTQSKAASLRRDGKWVTSPDETGLALMHNDLVVRRADGSPLILTWKQLQDLATPEIKKRERLFERHYRMGGFN